MATFRSYQTIEHSNLGLMNHDVGHKAEAWPTLLTSWRIFGINRDVIPTFYGRVGVVFEFATTAANVLKTSLQPQEVQLEAYGGL